MAKLARYEHVLFDGITSSMIKGECSGIVKDYSLRKLWRWERIESRDLHTVDIVNCEEPDDAFEADVIFPCGEIVHSHYYDGAIAMESWQAIIIDALQHGEDKGEFTDDNGTRWRWCKA